MNPLPKYLISIIKNILKKWPLYSAELISALFVMIVWSNLILTQECKAVVNKNVRDFLFRLKQILISLRAKSSS